MFDNFSASRARRLRKRKIKRFIVFSFAIIALSLILVLQSNPVLSEKLDSLIFLAKQVLVVPESTQIFLPEQSTNTPTRKVVVVLSETETQIPTITPSKTTVVITSTPNVIIRILTGLSNGTVYMRQGPSLSYPVIKVLAENDEMIFIKCTNEWAEIKIDNSVGFVYSKYTDVDCKMPEFQPTQDR